MAKKKTAKRSALRVIIIAAAALVLVAAIALGLVFGLRSCSKKPNVDEFSRYDADKYKTNAAVGVSMQYLGTTQRNRPVEQVKDESAYFNNAAYPEYGKAMTQVLGDAADKIALRNALIAESNYLTATGTKSAGGGGYVWMDAEGKLYNGTTAEPVPVLGKDGATQRQLYKHTASVGLYNGDVADDEQAIIKKVTMRSRGYDGYSVTGVYAPAGEVIKVQLSEEDMQATGGITVHIGQALYNGKANNIWPDKNSMPRIPHLLNTLTISKDTATLENGIYTAYVGSFLGGPIYIRNESVTFSATLSGGVAYSHFILGYTTEKEFEQNSRSSAPYFDLEVWDTGVLHSGPKSYAKDFTYEEIYDAAMLWDKVSAVANTNHTKQGIVFLYDPFVAAGAAVAFPGQRSVNCPLSWMKSSLDCEAVEASGSWGNFHEYHHNFQNFGVGYTGEVTNNALTLVSYSLFTKISAARRMANFGAEGLSGWNTYTSAPWALQRVNTGAITSTDGLAVYATLLHNLGQEAFIGTRGTSGVAYFDKWAKITHQDFSYYANLTNAYGGSLELQATDYPLFVPVSSVYQTGRSFNNDGEKKYVTTMQPYSIPYGEEFTVDLRPYTALNGTYVQGSVVIAKDFSYRIKSVDTSSINGTFEENELGSGVYTFTPNSEINSGKITVTLEITTADGKSTYNGHKLDDVDLVLEFNQSYEMNKRTLTRTTYTFAEGSAFTDAQQAYENGYSGYLTKTEKDNINFTQDSNTDIWYRPDSPEYANDEHLVPKNAVVEIRGKLQAEEDAKYRIFLRGRYNCALYYSTDGGKTYSLGATIKDDKVISASASFRPDDENTYFDLELKANDWVYFKEVLITGMVNGKATYIGIGMTKWDEQSVVDKNHQPYANAYRENYEFIDDGFSPDYLIKRQYSYTYAEREAIAYDENSSIVSYTKGNGEEGTWWYPPENIFNELEGDENRFQASHKILPITISVDIGRTVTANRCEITGYKSGGGIYYPQRFKILVYNTLEEMQADADGTSEENVFIDFTGADVTPVAGTADVRFTIPELKTFRYYKLIITKVNNNNYAQMHNVKFLKVFEVSSQQHSLDEQLFAYKGDWLSAQAQSSFGHVYVGGKGSSFSFEFTGTRVGFITSTAYGKNYEVYIDGKKTQSVALKEVGGGYGVTFLTEELSNGSHRVEVKCKGETAFDSVMISTEND